MNEYPEIFSIIDTETSGMRPPFSRVIDIGIIRVENGKEVERFQTLINPGTSLPSRISGITSITDEDLVDAPGFEDIALQVQELLQGSVFVAHNAPFDYAFIQSEFSRLGMSFSTETLCSVKLSRALSPKSRSHNLDSVIDRYGIEIAGQRHRALPDAEAVWEFMKRATKRHSSTDIANAVRRARSGSLGAGMPSIARDTFTDLPDSAGVYMFYGPEQELLYIGKSKHVRTRARSHFSVGAAAGSKKEERLQQETNTISTMKTSGELSALLLESALIKAQSPLYNRALRKRKMLVIAEQGMNEGGYCTLTLSRTAEIDPKEGALSVFRTMAQAKQRMRDLAKEHRLCAKLLDIETGDGACFGSQLGTCPGACSKKEGAEEYNERFDAAFTARRLRAWPYGGTVMIDEKESEERGTAIFIRDWVLLGAYTYDTDIYQPLFADTERSDGFEYDTYKILVRYLLNARNKRSIKTLSDTEYRSMLARIEGVTDEDVRYEVVID